MPRSIPQERAPDGVLVVDKPAQCTSHDVVAQARRLFGVRAVGHAGTLDPMATGVLVLLFGEACKLSSYLTLSEKSYRTTVQFGQGTDTLDADGRVIEQVRLPEGWLSESALRAAMDVELRRTEQVPPAVSAIQVGGQRSYDRARRGEVVELAPRAIALRKLDLLELGETHATFELTVSKGYYVRAFARDLGKSLGAPAHLSALRRLTSGSFTLKDAVTWPCSERPSLIPTVQAARSALPHTQLSTAGALRARTGQRLASNDAEPGAIDQVCAWLAPDGSLVALGTSDAAGVHRITRGFVTSL